MPDVVLPLAALSEKDRDDLEFACELGVDWLALSFVQRAEDVRGLQLARGRAAVLSKIEKLLRCALFPRSCRPLTGSWSRGRSGRRAARQSVPPIQKRLVRQCRAAAKPVIVATQMLESMIESPVPTRAEVSDVANAIYEGADAVMLSAESAAGDYPVEAVTTMDHVARSVESDPNYREVIEASRKADRNTVADGIVAAAREIAETTDISAICAHTQSGTTVSLVARERPRVPILALSPIPTVLRRLCLTWGTHCVATVPLNRFREAVISGVKIAREFGFANEKQQIVITAGVPINDACTTNILRVASCDEDLLNRAEAD